MTNSQAARFSVLAMLLAPLPMLPQCSYTPPLTTVTKTYSWQNGTDAIVVTPTGFSSTAPLQTAMTNWQQNIANRTYCGVFLFYFNPYPYQVVNYLSYIDVAYTSIPQPDPTHIIRGQTDLGDAAFITFDFHNPNLPPAPRLATVGIKINTIVTDAAAITEVFAHEIGHTFALNDCNQCGVRSTVMETGDSGNANTQIGLPGPTNSDIHYYVVLTGGETVCPLWNYPPCQP